MKKKQELKLSHDVTVILTALVAVLILILIFNTTALKNYFRGISQAAIINITDEIPVLNEAAREDQLSDLAGQGLAYLSFNTNNFNDTQLRYYNFTSGNSTMIAIGNVADFNFVKTNDAYVIYNTDNTLYWHSTTNSPFTNHPIPKDPAENDREGDIATNNKIVFARQAGGTTNLWQYQIDTGASTQLTFVNSSKQNIDYYYDAATGDEKIVWADDRNGDLDIYLYDFAQPNPNGDQITSDLADQSAPNIYQNKIVWTDTRNGPANLDIYMYDLANPTVGDQQITTDLTNQQWGTIYNNKIVWEDARNDAPTGPWTGNKDIYMHDLRDGKEYAVSAVPPGQPMAGDQLQPQIVRNKIVWTYAHGINTGYGGPNQDIFMVTFDELNLLAPDNGINFPLDIPFTDIILQWEYSSDNPIMPIFYIKTLLNGQPFPPGSDIGIAVGKQTMFTLKSSRVETYPDGIFTWSVLPAGLNTNPENWALAESRTITKKTAADLINPSDMSEVIVGTKFDWSDIPNATLYIAKIGNYLPEDKFLYLPLPGNVSEFIITQNIYDLLKPISGEKTYTWTVTGTQLPTPTDWQNIWYGPTRTFKVKT